MQDPLGEFLSATEYTPFHLEGVNCGTHLVMILCFDIQD